MKKWFSYFSFPHLPLQREKFNSRLQYCVVQKTHTNTVIILDIWGYLLKGKNFPAPEKKKRFFLIEEIF